MTNFADKVVVVTGGGSGLGKTIAEKFNQEGAKIAIFGRDSKKLEDAQKNLEQCITVAGDVGKIADLDRLYQTTQEKLGKIDILVANAGINIGIRPVDYVDEKYFDEMISTNFKGTYFTVQRAISYLNDNASVVLISSMAAHTGIFGFSVYSSTKAAVSMLARSFSADLMQRGIRVNAISPGYIESAAFTEDFSNLLKEKIPTQRLARAQEIADAVAYLSSPSASYILGIDLIIDGGFTEIAKN